MGDTELKMPGEDNKGHSWPDVAMAVLRHPFTSLFVGGSALLLAGACHLGYRLPFNDIAIPSAAAHSHEVQSAATPASRPG